MCDLGYGLTRKEIIQLAKDFASLKGNERTFGRGWYNCFRKRFPEMTTKYAKKIEKVCVTGTSLHFIC